MNTQSAEERIGALERELRLRDEFIAVATHELRNPLTPIALEVEVLLALARRRPEPSAAELASLERLQRSIKAFIRRATTFLDVTRIRSGNFTPTCQEIDLCEVLQRVLGAHAALAAQAGCLLETDAPPKLSGCWDPMAIEEILENLISNAVRYGAGKSVQIAVKQSPDTVEVRVTDHGAGVRAEDQDRIFNLFDRGAAMRSGSAGFGVGLWISRRFAQSMGGDIWVESTFGEGASFTLRLPHTERGHVIHDDQAS